MEDVHLITLILVKEEDDEEHLLKQYFENNILFSINAYLKNGFFKNNFHPRSHKWMGIFYFFD